MATMDGGGAWASKLRGQPHFGKHRGTVTDNEDPKGIGRVKAKVPEVLGDVETGWAYPCLPYSGDGEGLHAVPPPGAGVWIEFEAGNVSKPVWTGCWWPEGKVPKDNGGAEAKPPLKILRSGTGLMLALDDDAKKISVSDEQGRNVLTIEVDAGKVTLKAATKAIVEAPQVEVVENASHPMVFGDSLSQYLSQLVSQFNAHVHPGQANAGGPVSPAPPMPMLQPPDPSILSQKVKVG